LQVVRMEQDVNTSHKALENA